jgi:hypothetical protein
MMPASGLLDPLDDDRAHSFVSHGGSVGWSG